ncbi:MAG: type 2 lantipeptide synthetase LanM family protein [Acidobacteria bacterium]|nr:type 2 lantipeptide synthetase LanM family protein [Acidobacteriota bacterium]
MQFSPADRHAIAARAATIYERHAALAGITTPPVDPSSPAIRQWNQAFSPNAPDAFVRRLAWDDFDLASAARAASPSVEARLDVPDAWTVWLDLIGAEAPAVRTDLSAGLFPGGHGDDAQPFEELQALVLRAGRRALQDRVAASARARITAGVTDAFERQLAREAGRYVDLALFEYFRASRSGYHAFIEQMLDGGLVTFFKEYAALARQLATVLASWVHTTAEFYGRLDADRDVIAATFASGADPGVVVRVDPALSDPHHGRRRVCALTFDSGLRLVYKPRSVRVESAFGDLLRSINTGLDHTMPCLVVLDRDTHGWVEFAAHESLTARDEAARWFHRAGALMCVTSVLGARDLHRENLVATRGGPVLVDLELLLQPDGSRSAAAAHDQAPQGDQAAPPVSCLSTGMLSLIDFTPDGEPHDAGGLRGARTGALPFPTRVWRGCGTDALHVVDQSTFAVAGTHQVIVDGVVQDPGEYADDLVAGFSQAYRFLLANRDELLTRPGPLDAFAACFVRVLPRPTNQYAMLGHLLATPKYQRDGVTPSCATDVLHRAFSPSRTRPHLWPMAVEERRALGALDIPYFAVRGDDTGAFADGRLVIADYFRRSGLDAARERVRALTPDDLEAQLALLRRALSESVASKYPETTSPQATGSQDTDDSLVDAAEWVADALLSRAERTPDGLVWRYRPLVGGPGWRDHHLYDGSTGAGVFFSALAAVTGQSRWDFAARDVLAPIRAHADRFPVETLPADEPVGGSNGLGSVVYGLTVVAALRGDRSWLDLARRLAAAIPPRLTPFGAFDVVNGSAGAVLALLALHDVTGDAQVLAAARVCGQHLIDREVTAGPAEGYWPSDDGVRLLGFAHGTAGVAAALARLSAATGDRVFAQAARRAYRFVRRRQLQDSGNWPIAAAGDGSAAGGMMSGWCHGAPGIALSAIVAAGARPSPAISRGIESALRSVAHWQPASADHVCCGALGRADVLLVAGEQLGRADAVDAARALAVRVVDRARRRGHFKLSGAGTDYRVFDPGFFQGLSGVGYELLRLARPSGLPSVAGFGAPWASLRYCSPVAGEPGGSRAASSPTADAVNTECTS